MKIQYDYQAFSFQKYGGVSRYFYELVNNFSKNKDMQIKTPLVLSNNYYIADRKLIKHKNFFPNQDFRGRQKIISKINKLYSIEQIKKKDFDIFHPTYYDPYFLEDIGDRPFVLTVHDMIHEKFSDYFNANDNTSRNKKLLSEKASKIIAVSEHTKKDLIEIFDTKPSKIKVIYHGNYMISNNSILNTAIPNRYILFVGTRSGYKNFDSFISAVARLLNDDLGLSIVCAGGEKFNSNELSLLDKLSISSSVFQYNLDDNALAALYRQAELFVFPSLYEGFGIPILEAYASDCPVVCSDTSSLPEVAGSAAVYFDPMDVESIFCAVSEVLNDSSLQQKLIENGREQLKRFSWAKTAQETKKVYENII